jgi:hypothetical protein
MWVDGLPPDRVLREACAELPDASHRRHRGPLHRRGTEQVRSRAPGRRGGAVLARIRASRNISAQRIASERESPRRHPASRRPGPSQRRPDAPALAARRTRAGDRGTHAVPQTAGLRGADAAVHQSLEEGRRGRGSGDPGGRAQAARGEGAGRGRRPDRQPARLRRLRHPAAPHRGSGQGGSKPGVGLHRPLAPADGVGRGRHPVGGREDPPSDGGSPRAREALPEVLEDPCRMGAGSGLGLDAGVRGGSRRAHRRAPVRPGRGDPRPGPRRGRRLRGPADHTRHRRAARRGDRGCGSAPPTPSGSSTTAGGGCADGGSTTPRLAGPRSKPWVGSATPDACPGCRSC